MDIPVAEIALSVVYHSDRELILHNSGFLLGKRKTTSDKNNTKKMRTVLIAETICGPLCTFGEEAPNIDTLT